MAGGDPCHKKQPTMRKIDTQTESAETRAAWRELADEWLEIMEERDYIKNNQL